MSGIRVLIVDDSQMVRDMLADILSLDSGITVVGMAENGLQAIEQTAALKPDVVAMDINMPVMGGLEAIERIMSSTPVPILVITDLDQASIAFEALAKGALDVYQKSFYAEGMAADLIAKVKLLSKVKVIRHILPKSADARGGTPIFHRRKSVSVPPPNGERRDDRRAFKIIAIASSTGGPRALALILSEMREGCPVPIVVAQHMSDSFVGGLLDWLGSVTPIKVKFAADGESLRENHVYFSPPGMHMTVNASGRLALLAVPPGDLFHPSCNMLLASVGEAFGTQSLGVILTGMGDDGVEGLRNIRKHGGYTVAQDEATSVVFGMPKVAIDSGVIDKISPVSEIGGLLKQLVLRK
ncbi:MAG: chemotaxis-specific protein-glutamate methyltransferase CheB [Gallionella sp.]|nr:chemotaxis-specific protein-glutamate methyltransferase CheB [Gallionella sp.]